VSLWLTGDSPATGLVVTNEVVSVTRGTIQQTVASSGTIEPASQANLNFAVSGTVTAVNVKAGQAVTAGQVLATVGTTALEDQLEAAQSQLAAAQDKLATDEDSSSSASQIDSDEASVTSAQSSLTTAQTNLADASLTSTIAGTVASVSLAVGQSVTGSGGGGGGDSAGAGDSTSDEVVVIGTDSYVVNTTVDDTQVGQIAEGDQATITPTGATTPVYGTVASIGEIATESSDVATFPVVIDVTGNPGGLYAGATASVSIIVKQLTDVVEVPTAAISYAGGKAEVTEEVKGKHVSTPVTVGESSDGETQIVSGVTSGDHIIEQEIKFTGAGGKGITGRGNFGGRGTFGGGTGTFGGGGTGTFGGGGTATFGGAGG
jgi:macrolide-specific efflux system membrane fusion protein